MSYASSDSPSVLLKKDQNQYKIYLQPQEAHTEFNKTNADDNSEDIYYGTEELLDALPKVWTRGVLYVLVGFAFLALPWATLSKVDETGSARGRIEPQGATQKLDSPAVGTVKAVKVKPGDTVEAGQVLLKLDSEILQTELEKAQAQLSALLNQESHLELLKNQVQLSLSIQKQQNQFQALEKMSQVNQAKQTLGMKESNYKLQKLERQALLHQVKQQLQAAKNDYQAAKNRLDIDSRQVNRFRQLVDDGAVSINQVDQLRKEEQESKRLYAQAESNIKQAQLRLTEETNRYQAVMNQLESQIEQAQHQLSAKQNSYQSLLQSGKLEILRFQEQLKNIERQLANLQAEITQNRGIITSLNIQMQQRVVRSPVDGVVFELPVTQPGEVVQLGQRIAHIAPKDTELVIKANIPVQDSGLLRVGMPVKLKFDAFPFQEFGIVEGKVAWISPDSQVSETSQGNIETYQLEITFEQKYVNQGGTAIPLTPGQTANAEVIVRQRRVIDFVLDPFRKLYKTGLEL